MVRILGIIAEYNPFHNGHAYHLKAARDRSGADYVIVVMSSCFTQRGDAALLSPADRARMALTCGADAVFSLPARWAVQDAEHFALGGVALLAGLGCTAISFGTENADLAALQDAARLLEQPSDEFRGLIQAHLSSGVPYPQAAASAANQFHPGLGELISAPNSTLAISYLRALERLHATMDVVPICRTSGDYHDTALSCSELPSATALRGAILRGDWPSVRHVMPAGALDILRTAAADGCIHHPDALDQALLYRLRTMSPEDFRLLPNLSEGLEYRLSAAAQSAISREDLLQRLKTRRYPHARLSRLVTHALLHLEESTDPNQLPDAAWLLGFRRDARALFAHLRQHATLPIISKVSDWQSDAAWFRTEKLAYDLWALGAHLPAGLAMRQGVAVI